MISKPKLVECQEDLIINMEVIDWNQKKKKQLRISF